MRTWTIKNTNVTIPKPKLSRGFKAEAEREAVAMRAAMGLAKHDPLCAFKLAEHLGIPIKTINEYGVPDDGERYDDWYAALIYTQSGKPKIIHNKYCSPYRQQSDIMHEISHYHCKHPIIRHPPGIIIPGNVPTVNSRYEDEAACLGSVLQLPREALAWAIYQKRMPLSAISETYTASRQMVQKRVNLSGLWNEVKRLGLNR